MEKKSTSTQYTLIKSSILSNNIDVVCLQYAHKYSKNVQYKVNRYRYSRYHKTSKMISISLCKQSQSAHPTHHILNQELQSHCLMKIVKKKKDWANRVNFFLTIIQWEMTLRFTVQNVMCGMSRLRSFTQRNRYYFNKACPPIIPNLIITTF